jgi:trans-2-enoyl-CoA reductase
MLQKVWKNLINENFMQLIIHEKFTFSKFLFVELKIFEVDQVVFISILHTIQAILLNFFNTFVIAL